MGRIWQNPHDRTLDEIQTFRLWWCCICFASMRFKPFDCGGQYLAELYALKHTLQITKSTASHQMTTWRFTETYLTPVSLLEHIKNHCGCCFATEKKNPLKKIASHLRLVNVRTFHMGKLSHDSLINQQKRNLFFSLDVLFGQTLTINHVAVLLVWQTQSGLHLVSKSATSVCVHNQVLSLFAHANLY